MPARLRRSRSLAATLSAVAAATCLAACGSSKTGPIDGKTPGGYRTVTETISGDRFSVAVPSAWKSSAIASGSAHLIVFSPDGVSAGDRSALVSQSGLVLVGWTPKTSVSVDGEITGLEDQAGGLRDLKSTVTRVYLPGTADSKILDQTYSSANGRAGRSSTLVVATNGAGLIDVEAISSSPGAGLTPTDATDAFSFKR